MAEPVIRSPVRDPPGLLVRGNGHTPGGNVPRRGSIRVLLSQTSKALGLPFNESDTPDSLPLTHSRAFQFQRQTTDSSLIAPISRGSVGSESGNLVRRCCKRYISKMIAHFILVMVLGSYILMGTLLYVYIIGPKEEKFDASLSVVPFDVDSVVTYLRTAVLSPIYGQNSTIRKVNLDHFRLYLRHRIREAGVYENKRDFSPVSGILYSVSVISGIGKARQPIRLCKLVLSEFHAKISP